MSCETIEDHRFRYLPHRLWLDDDKVELIPTDPGMLRAATFLDGRSDFSTGPKMVEVLSHWLAAQPVRLTPDRYIFHVAFCGSTLLSRLLDNDAHTLVLREPNCLVDLAVHRAALDRGECDDPKFASVIRGVCSVLRQSWHDDERVIVKPTSWINNIVPEICASADIIRPLFLTMSRAAFVRAVFRGGADRIAFVARAAIHLSARGRSNAELVSAALARDVDQSNKLAGLAIITHHIQMKLFEEAARTTACGAANWLTFEELVANPRVAALKAAAALDVKLPDGALDDSCARWLGQNAKQPDLTYSAAAEGEMSMRATAAGGVQIDAALCWANETIGEEALYDQARQITALPNGASL